MLKIRKAKPGDVDKVVTILNIARQYMRNHGNFAQWTGSYPNGEDAIYHMEKDEFYVGEDENGEVRMCFAFCFGEDETYKVIENGKWLNDEEYGAIHMIASDGTTGGCFVSCLEFCKGIKKNIRIDTHKDNLKMNSILKENGFEFCGIIYVKDGTPRNAYQLKV